LFAHACLFIPIVCFVNAIGIEFGTNKESRCKRWCQFITKDNVIFKFGLRCKITIIIVFGCCCIFKHVSWKICPWVVWGWKWFAKLNSFFHLLICNVVVVLLMKFCMVFFFLFLSRWCEFFKGINKHFVPLLSCFYHVLMY
jgi:hypothetical protein